MGIKWDESFEIGEEMIDAQHREFISRLNAVSETMMKGRGAGELSATVGFLEEYVKIHFEYEELLMAKLLYPGFFEHREMHRRFKEMAEKIKKAAGERDFKTGSVVGVHKAMSVWIVKHIKTEDSKIGSFLKGKGGEK